MAKDEATQVAKTAMPVLAGSCEILDATHCCSTIMAVSIVKTFAVCKSR